MATEERFPEKEKLNKIAELDFEDDILLVGYPRTGTTWLQELLWIIEHDGDLAGASSEQVGCRVPFLESRGYDWEHSVDDLHKHPHPRVMKTHMYPDMFRSKLNKLKMVISIRNPKDTVVSLYNYFQMWKDERLHMQLKELIDVFVGSRPMTPSGQSFSYFDWYSKAIPMLSHKNVLLIRYEDHKKDPKKQIRTIASFLGKNLDKATINAIADHCSFEKLKQNLMVNQSRHEIYDQSKGNFFRKGEAGGWRDVLTEEQSKLIDERHENSLKKAGLELDFN